MTIDPRDTEALFTTFENAVGSGKNCREALAAYTEALANLLIPYEPRPGDSLFVTEEYLTEWSRNQAYRDEILEIAASLDPPY